MQKTENIYMQDNNRRMPEIVDDLYFVIDEKLNSVELQDKGRKCFPKTSTKKSSSCCPTWGRSWPISRKAT